MSLISSGINNVRAIYLPSGIWEDGSSFGSPRFALVRWQSSWSDKLYQVYINGKFGGGTNETDQRELIVALPTFFNVSVRIEVYAVAIEDFVRDFSDELQGGVGESGRVRLSFLRSQDLPLGSTLKIYSNNGSGEVDYDEEVNEFSIEIWPFWQDKCGFGMSSFGNSDFGFDWSAGIGFGKGLFGQGEFGVDADLIEWVSGELEAGTYKFGVKVVDEIGHQSLASETDEITVIPSAKPAEKVEVYSYNKDSNELILSVS